MNEWEALYNSLPPLIDKITERYVTQLVDEWNMDRKTVLDQLKTWEKEGKVQRVGKRRIGNGRVVETWCVCKTLGKS